MITVRQIEKLWNARGYERLLEQLLFPRPESSDRLRGLLGGALPTAAMAIIRLDELSQSYTRIYSELVRMVVNAQRPDGGWGDVMTTALCLRALLCGGGNGRAVDRGLECLAGLQKADGIWPVVPSRRMPVDAFASAFVLMRLGDCVRFCEAVRLDEAVEWFEDNELALDTQTRKLWSHAQRRFAKPAVEGVGVGSMWGEGDRCVGGNTVPAEAGTPGVGGIVGLGAN